MPADASDPALTGPLAGRVLLVAGGAGAVGSGIVRSLARAGATVVVPSRRAERLAALAAQVPAVVGLVGDVGDPDGAADLRDRVVAAYGGLDGVVAALGGWWQGARVADLDLADWDRVMADNLRPHAVVARTFLPLLRARAGSSYTLISGDARRPRRSGPARCRSRRPGR